MQQAARRHGVWYTHFEVLASGLRRLLRDCSQQDVDGFLSYVECEQNAPRLMLDCDGGASQHAGTKSIPPRVNAAERVASGREANSVHHPEHSYRMNGREIR